MNRLLVAVAFALGAQAASAADYYWETNTTVSTSSGSRIVRDKSPSAICSKIVWTDGYQATSLTFDAQDAARCNAKRESDGYTAFAGLSRLGNSCPTGSDYDPAKGECVSKEPDDPCSAKAGQSTPFSKSGTGGDGYMSIFDAAGGKKSAPAQSGCFNGCAASTAQQKCTVKVAGSYFCRGTAYYTGAACGTSDTATLDVSDTSAFPDAQTISDKKPCVYTIGADGAQTCTSETSTEKEGQNCGTYNGQTICADKKPNSEKMKIDTNVSETSNPDGSKVVTKVDVSSNTVCSGVQTCVTTTTTTTTRITKDKDGNTTSSSSTTNSTTGTGGKNDGSGSSAGKDEGGSAGGTCVSAEDCSDGSSASGPELGEVPSYQESAQKFYDTVAGGPLGSAVAGIKMPTGGTQGSYVTGSIPELGGVSLDVGTPFWTLLAAQESKIRAVCKAAWAVAAVIVFLLA